MKLAGLKEELKETLNKDVDLVTERTYTEIHEETPEGRLAKKIFFDQICKDRKVIYE